MKPEIIEMLKKMAIFFALFFALIGAGCSLGWLGYHKEWFAFVGCLVVIGFAVPTFIKLLKELLK